MSKVFAVFFTDNSADEMEGIWLIAALKSPERGSK